MTFMEEWDCVIIKRFCGLFLSLLLPRSLYKSRRCMISALMTSMIFSQHVHKLPFIIQNMQSQKRSMNITTATVDVHIILTFSSLLMVQSAI